MYRVNVSCMDIFRVTRNINRIVEKLNSIDASETDRITLTNIVSASLKEVTAYVFHVCYNQYEYEHYTKRIEHMHSELLKHSTLLHNAKTYVIPLCIKFSKELKELNKLKDGRTSKLPDSKYTGCNSIGGVTTLHSEVITLDLDGVKAYIDEVLTVILK